MIHAPVWTVERAWDNKQLNEHLHGYAPLSGLLMIVGLGMLC